MTPEALIIESLFRIPDKDGADVDFKLNPAQQRVDEGLTGRDVVPKARQEGVSSYILARYTAACMMYRNTRAVVISHDRESTQRLLARVEYYIEHLRGPKPKIQNMSKNEITFPKMNSMFYIGTAGSRLFGRGDTITHLHCSEYAYWPNPIELMKGLLQAVPGTGEVAIESTGNGYNDYHRRCIRAYKEESIWNLIFLPWHTFDEYQVAMAEQTKEQFRKSLNPDWEEPTLLEAGLTLEQLFWRRHKLDELDYDLAAFKQEYPMTLDECFQMSGASIFNKVQYEPTDRWKKQDRGLWILDGHPASGLTYVLGGDVGAGIGKDSSINEIFCLETAEQVAEYSTNSIDPEVFGERTADLARMFNEAYVVVEANNHGILTLAKLRTIYPSHKIYGDDSVVPRSDERQLLSLGYRTTKRSKPLMIGTLKTMLAKLLTIHSPLLNTQLSTFIEHEDGKLAAQDGCEDDAVMAAACGAMGYNRAALFKSLPAVLAPGKDPFAVDNIIDELRGRASGFPVRPQHGWGIVDAY